MTIPAPGRNDTWRPSEQDRPEVDLAAINWDKVKADQIDFFMAKLDWLSSSAIGFLIYQAIKLASSKRSEVIGWAGLFEILRFAADRHNVSFAFQSFSDDEKQLFADYLDYLLSDDSHLSLSKKANFDIELEDLAESLKMLMANENLPAFPAHRLV